MDHFGFKPPQMEWFRMKRAPGETPGCSVHARVPMIIFRQNVDIVRKSSKWHCPADANSAREATFRWHELSRMRPLWRRPHISMSKWRFAPGSPRD